MINLKNTNLLLCAKNDLLSIIQRGNFTDHLRFFDVNRFKGKSTIIRITLSLKVVPSKQYWLWINPFHTIVLFLYPLKTSENLRFSDVFRGYRKRSEVVNGLNNNFKRLFIYLINKILNFLLPHKICQSYSTVDTMQ